MGNNDYCVYIHTTPSEKVYIGITNQKVTHRWGKDGNNYDHQVFGNAVRKYGWENIKHEILFDGLSLEEAEKKERELIAQYNATDRHCGYNCTTGGSVCRFSDDTRKRISDSLTGRKLSEEHRANIAKCRMGWDFSEETRKRIGAKHRNKVVSEVAKEHLREAHQWQAKRVAKLSIDGEIIEVFNSVGDAAKETGCSKYLIRRVCQGKRQTTNGFRWAFYEGGDSEEWQNQTTDTVMDTM